jgi:hypothetical protein
MTLLNVSIVACRLFSTASESAPKNFCCRTEKALVAERAAKTKVTETFMMLDVFLIFSGEKSNSKGEREDHGESFHL